MELKRQYTKEEWEIKEEEYINALLRLKSASVNQTKDDVLDRLSQLDGINTIATFDFMQCERNLERTEMDRKNAEVELFTLIKIEQLDKGNKCTENEVKGLVKKHLKENPLPGYKTPVFAVLSVVMHRHAFMKSVIEDIKNKRSSIISSLSLLKLESSLSPATQDAEVYLG